jgi:hypothetical protein
LLALYELLEPALLALLLVLEQRADLLVGLRRGTDVALALRVVPVLREGGDAYGGATEHQAGSERGSEYASPSSSKEALLTFMWAAGAGSRRG